VLLHDCKASISTISIDKPDIVGSLHHSRPMKRLTPKTLVVLALVAAASVAGFFSSFTGENRPIIDVPLHCLDLGTVLVQNDMRWKLPLTNTTRQPIAVRLKASCFCTGVSPQSFAIPVGGSVQATLRLDLSPPAMRGRNAPKWTPAEWPFSVTLHADILGKPGMAWEVKGLVQSPLVFSATKLTIGPGAIVSLGGSTTVTREADGETSLVVRSVKPVRSVEVTCATDVATGRLTQGFGGSADDFVFRIEPDALVTPGRYEFDAVVTAVTKDGGQATVRIPVSMFVVDDVAVSPACVVFGTVASESPAIAEVTVTSQLNESYVIESIEVDEAGTNGDHIRVTRTGDNGPSTEHRLQVALQGDHTAYREHRVRLQCFYPTKRLSTRCEFLVVAMPESPDA